MVWRTLVAALVVLPPTAYVVGALDAPEESSGPREVLVLEDDRPSAAPVERQVTLAPRPDPRPDPPHTPRPDRLPDDDTSDDTDDDTDDGGGVTVVRPAPQGSDEDRGDDGDDRDGVRGDAGERDDDDDDDEGDD